MSKETDLENKDEAAIRVLFEQSSTETTSNKLDDSILQMAASHVQQQSKVSWWKRLKYPVTLTAAMVVTVGIARFMVHLGGTDINAAQNLELAEHRQSQTVIVLSDGVELESDSSFAFDNYLENKTADVEVSRESAVKEVEFESFDLAKVEAIEANAEQQLAALKKSQEERLTRMRQEEEVSRSLSLKSQSTDNQELELFTTEDKVATLGAEKSLVASAPVMDEESQTIRVTGSRIAAQESREQGENKIDALIESQGVLDEAVLGYPLPEVWIEQIEQALSEGDEIKALDEWGQFSRTYPDYKVSEKLLNQLKSLEKLGEKH